MSTFTKNGDIFVPPLEATTVANLLQPADEYLALPGGRPVSYTQPLQTLQPAAYVILLCEDLLKKSSGIRRQVAIHQIAILPNPPPWVLTDRTNVVSTWADYLLSSLKARLLQSKQPLPKSDKLFGLLDAYCNAVHPANEGQIKASARVVNKVRNLTDHNNEIVPEKKKKKWGDLTPAQQETQFLQFWQNAHMLSQTPILT